VSVVRKCVHRMWKKMDENLADSIFIRNFADVHNALRKT
jgi:hypothetical protein